MSFDAPAVKAARAQDEAAKPPGIRDVSAGDVAYALLTLGAGAPAGSPTLGGLPVTRRLGVEPKRIRILIAGDAPPKPTMEAILGGEAS